MQKLCDAVRQFQERFVTYALIESGGNIRQAAKILGKSPATMDRWIGILGLRGFACTLRHARNDHLEYLAARYGLMALAFFAFVFYPTSSLI